jgi:UDP-glucose 4-epimerase
MATAGVVGNIVKRSGLADFSPDQVAFLAFGRGLDTTRMREVFAFAPQYTTREAFADFAEHLRPVVPGVGEVTEVVTGAAGGGAATLARVFERLQQ